MTKDSIAPGYPKAISSRWRGLTRDFDAAFTHNNRKSYFFKGTKYWKYTGTTLDKDYPKEISYGFPGIPNNIDSVFYTANNNKVYFFKGELIYYYKTYSWIYLYPTFLYYIRYILYYIWYICFSAWLTIEIITFSRIINHMKFYKIAWNV